MARHGWGIGLFTGLAVVGSIAFNQTTTNVPLVELPNSPLFVNGSKSKTNLTLVLSIEEPTLGSAYTSTVAGDPDDFNPRQKYIGYHDHMVCYANVSAIDMTVGEYFAFSSKKTSIDAACPRGTSFDGNFLNWATTSSMDILRYGLTGGHRVFDEGSGAGRTVLERAYLPDSMYRSSFFPMKRLHATQVALRTPFSGAGLAQGLYIRNCRNRVYFANQDDTFGDCEAPFGVEGANSTKLLRAGSTSGGRFYPTRVMVCDERTAANRPMLQNAATGQWSGLCQGQWRSILVSGAGAGAQGVFALDVSDPTAFSKDSVLWEFTDADHPAMGNVLGKPRIARVRMNDPGSGTDNHKWMAVVPSGVNNHRPDEHTNTSAHPSIFLIDLEARPSPSAPWKEGVNFWRIELPPGNDSAAPGLIQINTVQTPGHGVLETIVAGDLHGNVWMLSFRQKGVNTLGKDGLANLSALNAVGANQHPMYVARAPDGARQPITSAPVIANGFGGRRLILVGTGKFLEASDNSVPTTPAASFYALPESTNPIADRGTLQGTSIDANGKISAESSSPGTQDKQKQGWYIDFSSAAGERLVSDPMLDRGRLVFTTLTPAGGACGEGGGRYFEVDVLTGQGASWDSIVGLLGGPMLVSLGNPVVSDSDTSGRRTAIYRQTPITQGGKGLDVGGGGTSTLTFTQQVGRMSWRQVHNHQHVAP